MELTKKHIGQRFTHPTFEWSYFLLLDVAVGLAGGEYAYGEGISPLYIDFRTREKQNGIQLDGWEPYKYDVKNKTYEDKKMNKHIVKLYPKTSDAVLVEQYFEGKFQSEFDYIIAKGHKAEILASAKQHQKEDDKA